MSTRELAAIAWYESLKPVEREGHDVVLLEGGREYFPALEEALGQAVTEIFVETYIFEDGVGSRRIATALGAAARRGVEVHLVVDGFGTPKLAPEIARILQEGGVQLQVFRPEQRRFALNRQRLRRLHRKLAVIDARVAFVGGINFLDDDVDPNYGALDAPRLDYAVRVRGPIVASLHLAARRLWWELSIVNRPLQMMRAGVEQWAHLVKSLVSDVTPAGNLRAMLVLRDNVRFRRTIEREYLRAILRARREVLIANAYFFPGVRFRRALTAAAARGVRVRLLLQGRAEYLLQHYASQALYDDLLRAGVEIVEYRRSFLHAKVAVIDDWATVGSSNIDPFSLLLAREANVVVHDPGFAAHLRERLVAAMSAGGVPVQLHRHERRPWPARVLNWFGFVMLRLGIAISGAAGRY